MKLILEDWLSDFDGGLSTNTVGGEKESRTKKEQGARIVGDTTEKILFGLGFERCIKFPMKKWNRKNF